MLCGVVWVMTPRLMKRLAWQALDERDYETASLSIERFEAWVGRDAESCFLRARLCRKRGDWDGVREFLLQARDRQFPIDRLEREQWLTLAQSGQLRAAEFHLPTLLTDPRDDGAEICEAFVNGYFINHRLTDALRLLDVWIADFPKDSEPLLIRGKIRAEQQFLKDSESDLRAALSLNPDSDTVKLELADVLVLERDIKAANEIYRKVSPKSESSVRARVGEAKTLRLLNQPQAALAAAKQVLDRDPGNREGLLELGLAELDLNEPVTAASALQQALTLNPRSLVVHQALARALRATGDLAHAREHAEYVANAQSALQRADELATRITQQPEDAEMRYEIGMIYLKYAVPERGVQWLKSVLNCNPNHRDAQRALDDYFANRGAAESVVSALPDSPGTDLVERSRDSKSDDVRVQPTVIQFQERMPDSKVPFIYRNGEEAEQSTILEGIGGGAAVIDFDLDGRPDLLFPGGGQLSPSNSLEPQVSALFRNDGQWQFRRCESPAGLDSPAHYGHGMAVADYDNDGFPDLLLTGYGGIQLLHNQGDGTFTDVTAGSNIDDRLWSTSAAWGDFNGDGCVDLYVAHYVDWSFANNPLCPTVDGQRRERCPPQRFGPQADAIYLSERDGSFVNSSDRCGLRPDGKGLGVVLSDLDLDGDLDIYVANDTVGNFLYRNEGQNRFEEIAVAAGVAFNDTGSPDGSMGVTVADYNLDGLPDLWVANYERETIALYKNLGDCNFEHVSQSTGVSVVGTMYVGFGTVFFDADLDGDQDVFVANGHVLRFPNNAPVRQQPLLFENLEGQHFINVASQAGQYCREPHTGRGVAHGDLDDDGDLDLVVSHLNEPVSLLENTTEARGEWLKLRLIGMVSNRDAIGARVILRCSGREQVRQISSGDSYLSHSDRTIHWGLPQNTAIDSITIEWPTGQIQTFDTPSLNQSLTIRESVRVP